MNRMDQNVLDPIRADPIRAEPSRAEPSQAEPSRAERTPVPVQLYSCAGHNGAFVVSNDVLFTC